MDGHYSEHIYRKKYTVIIQEYHIITHTKTILQSLNYIEPDRLFSINSLRITKETPLSLRLILSLRNDQEASRLSRSPILFEHQ
jgi:hypothetical protein